VALTAEQRERIAVAKASIRADIAAARRRAATGRSSHARSTKTGSTHGGPPSVGPEPSS
jgi:hypothetical protein